MSERTLKPWESGSIPVTGDSGKVRPAPVQFEDVELDFDDDEIEYASMSPPLPPPLAESEEEDDNFDDDAFEGVHTNVTSVNELKKWLDGGPPPDGRPVSQERSAFDPQATSLVSGADMSALLDAARNLKSQDQVPSAEAPAPASNFTVSGSLEAFQLGELLQLFASSRRTGALTLVHDGSEGRLFMNMGEVYAAKWNGVAPDDPSDVMRHMAKMKKGDFRFGPLQKDPPPANVNMSMPQLLILLLADDEHFGSEDIALDAPLTLADPLTAPLRALTAEELDVLQWLHNDKTLEKAMTRDGVDPDRLQEIVGRLVERGYLRRLEFLENEDDFFGGGLF